MPIKTDDPAALEKLDAKLNACIKLQETMKAVNAIVRSSRGDEEKRTLIMNKHHISAESIDDLLHPAFIDIYFYPKSKMGGAYSFTNPLNKKCKLYLEGNLRREKSVRAFVYIKRADGTIKLLTDDMDSDAWQQQETKLKDRTLVRHYLKLQFEEEFNPGDILVMACTPRDGKFPAKGYIFSISGWGAKWNSVISLETAE